MYCRNKSKKEKISIIIPCYNEAENIDALINALNENLSKLNYFKEYIFIDDGSIDDTLNLLKMHASQNNNINIISFSRNFGKESAMYAGLEKCTGDYAVFIDADLQHDPKLIIDMTKEFEKEEKLNIVAYYTEQRNENKTILLLKNVFYKIINKTSGLDFKNGVSDFRMFDRKVINAILKFKELDRFQKGIFSYVGFNIKYLKYSPNVRLFGTSRWGLKKLFCYATDGIFSFSENLSKIPLFIGICELTISIVWFLMTLLFKKIGYNFLTIMIFILFLFSILTICVGVIGRYILIIFKEVKGRPIYIVKESTYEK